MSCGVVSRDVQHTNGPGKLNIVRLMRDILLGAHQRTEHNLIKDAKTMRRTLQVLLPLAHTTNTSHQHTYAHPTNTHVRTHTSLCTSIHKSLCQRPLWPWAHPVASALLHHSHLVADAAQGS